MYVALLVCCESMRLMRRFKQASLLVDRVVKRRKCRVDGTAVWVLCHLRPEVEVVWETAAMHKRVRLLRETAVFWRPYGLMRGCVAMLSVGVRHDPLSFRF